MRAKKQLKYGLVWLMVCLSSLTYAETTVNCASFGAHPDWDALVTLLLKVAYTNTQINDCHFISMTREQVIYEYWIYNNTQRKSVSCANTKPKPTSCDLN